MQSADHLPFSITSLQELLVKALLQSSKEGSQVNQRICISQWDMVCSVALLT